MGGEVEYYAAYGLTIRSTFELPELPTVDPANEQADVDIDRGDVEPVTESTDESGGRHIVATPDACRLTYDSIGSFLVDGGERILFDPTSEAVTGKKVVRRLFENEMLGLVLHQRGLLVLHASAVSVDGKAAIFLGPRGAGKSTTAAAFDACGHATLEDDVVGIRFDGDVPTVVPGVPELRLKPDAIEALGIERTTRYEDDGGSGKRYQSVEAVPDPAPLAGCYVMRVGESVALEELPERDGLIGLVTHTYARGLLAETETQSTHFRQCSTIAESTPMQLLRRTRRHEDLPALVELVAADLRERVAVES